MPLGDFKQHFPAGGIKGDFAVVAAAEGLVRVGQLEAQCFQCLFLLGSNLAVLVLTVEHMALVDVGRAFIQMQCPIQNMNMVSEPCLELLNELGDDVQQVLCGGVFEEINTIANSITRISLKYSMPEWIVKKFCEEYSEEETAYICQNLNLRPNISVRLNRLKDKIELGEKGILEDFRVITGTKNITKTKEYIEGNITIQDEAAGLSSFVLAPKEGEMVLDACSAPGGKTTYLAELMHNKGNIVAWDIYEERLKQVDQNAKRLGIDIIQTEVHDATKLKEEYINKFDKILLDVPCLGLGVIRRKPDIKWNRQESDIEEIANIQYNILKTCSKYLKNNGVLVYSTCSMLKEENNEIIEKFIKDENFEIVNIDEQIPNEFSKITINKMVQFLPSQKHDGFFLTMLQVEYTKTPLFFKYLEQVFNILY